MSSDVPNVFDAVVRSLIGQSAFEEFERTGQYNTGNGLLNRSLEELKWRGYFTPLQHTRFRNHLTANTMNSALEDLPGAKRKGAFVYIPGGK